MPHVGTEIPRRPARALSCRARSASRTPTGTSTALYDFAARRSAPACSCRAARATSIDLNRPPDDAPMYPGANNTELCPTRFFTGDAAVPRRRRARRGRESARGARLLAAVPRRAAPASSSACSAEHGHACCSTPQHPVASAVAVRRRAARPEPRHRRRRELRAGAARRAGRRCCAGAGSLHATSSTAASRAATSRATTAARPNGVHAVQLEMCQCLLHATKTPPLRLRTRRAARSVQPLLREHASTRRWPHCASARMSALTTRRFCAPRAWVARRLGATTCCCESDADGRWARRRRRRRRAAARRRALRRPGAARPGRRAQPRVPARVRRPGRAPRAAAHDDFWTLARPHVRASRSASRPSSCARSRRSCTSSCCAAATRRSANSTTCSTTPTAGRMHDPADDVAGAGRAAQRRRHRADAAARALHARRLRGAGAARRPAALRARRRRRCCASPKRVERQARRRGAASRRRRDPFAARGRRRPIARAAPPRRTRRMPMHIHIAEQQREVDDCIARHGRAADRMAARASRRRRRAGTWCTPRSRRRTRSAAVRPTRRRHRASARAPRPTWATACSTCRPGAARRGRWSIGSDSHVTRSWPEELRLLEYVQRLSLRQRNVAARAAGRDEQRRRAVRRRAGAAGRRRRGAPLGGLERGAAGRLPGGRSRRRRPCSACRPTTCWMRWSFPAPRHARATCTWRAGASRPRRTAASRGISSVRCVGSGGSGLSLMAPCALATHEPGCQADAAEPALPGRWRRPLEGERRRRSGGGPFQRLRASVSAVADRQQRQVDALVARAACR